MTIRKQSWVVILAAVTLAVSLTACNTTQTPGEQFDDQTIKSKINAKLTGDSETNPFNIDVDVRDRVVYLRGEVEKPVAKTEAEKIAKNTTGVVRVVNELRVVSAAAEDDEEGSDAWITAKVKAKLIADPDINPFNIDVDTEDGIVTLSGEVKKREAKSEAEQLARNTKGVKSVRNQIRIAS